MGFKSIDKPGWSAEVQRHPKMSISFYWLQMGGGWGLSPSTSPANHPKLNVIQKWAFHFFWLERDGGWGLSPSLSPANHQKLSIIQKRSISFFWLQRGGGWSSSPLTSLAIHQKLNIIKIWAFHFIVWRRVADGVWVHQLAWLIIRSEHNPKGSISFYWPQRGGGWGLSPLTSLANIRSWT